MISAAMAIKEGNGIMKDGQLNVTGGGRVKEELYCGKDYVPTKVRKPYIITKHREKWTEEEHKKFLEALKLYGRDWRQIEEFVGTKTAIQIRSHAQKFFSKVVRSSPSSNTSTLVPIEIPPPRPKRKPVHPYPRKLVNLQNREFFTPWHTVGSVSPNISISDKEYQSATSVLSAVSSDALGSSEYSNTPNGGLSLVSSAANFQPGGLVLPEQKTPSVENESTSSVPETADSVPAENHHVKLELSTINDVSSKEVLGGNLSAQSLKLFGRTVYVADSHIPTSLIPDTSKLLNHDMTKVKPLQPSKWTFVATESSGRNTECARNPLPHRVPGAHYVQQFQNKNSNTLEAGSSFASLPWTLYEGMPVAILPFHGIESTNENTNSTWTSSNTGSANKENAQRSSDVEMHGCQTYFFKEEKELEPGLNFKLSDKSGFSGLRGSLNKLI